MLTVGEKRRVLEIMALGLAAEIDFDFPSVAADEKPPALMLRGLRETSVPNMAVSFSVSLWALKCQPLP